MRGDGGEDDGARGSRRSKQCGGAPPVRVDGGHARAIARASGDGSDRRSGERKRTGRPAAAGRSHQRLGGASGRDRGATNAQVALVWRVVASVAGPWHPPHRARRDEHLRGVHVRCECERSAIGAAQVGRREGRGRARGRERRRTCQRARAGCGRPQRRWGHRHAWRARRRHGSASGWRPRAPPHHRRCS